MLYSKDGSIPKKETDGTEGWIEVPEPPSAGEGEEVVWWYPPGWVVRPVKPSPAEGGEWNWSQSEGKWILAQSSIDSIAPQVEITEASTGFATAMPI